MTTFSIDDETDPVRRAIVAAMNRLFTGKVQRSSGRLNVCQLAIEADVKRWHLTHQHLDLKERFQAHVAQTESQKATHLQDADALTELQQKHAELQAHCRFLEARLHTYATALNLLSLENAALCGQDAEATKVRTLPRPSPHLP
ncbi:MULTISPECIES: hypothetical protein [Streptomyces]|jgi:hypothetical protein|uniref:hypothetical protein n=1 Tax=Streptomyces TaxID=1883 RepID=UPI000C1ACC1F|nr:MULTISPECIES: hypothetical protein [Streptomyces]MCX4437776.1 hypothetical protein [Streptomyces mirabilis]QIY93368.1 hypothetical protein HEP87_03390 [Streptomyces sp. S1D4-11]